MASIRMERELAAQPLAVWDALADVGHVHTRLARGFVVNTTLDGNARRVTFANGLEVLEYIVTVDHAEQRLVYSARGGLTSHHNASFTMFPVRAERTRLVWLADVMPDSAAGAVEQMMARGLDAIQGTLESSGAR